MAASVYLPEKTGVSLSCPVSHQTGEGLAILIELCKQSGRHVLVGGRRWGEREREGREMREAER